MTDKHIPASKLLGLKDYEFNSHKGDVLYIKKDDLRALIDEAPESVAMASDENFPTEYDPADHDYSTPLKFMSEQDDEAVAYYHAETDTPVSKEQWEGLKVKFANDAEDLASINSMPPLYTRPASKTYTESDIDVAIGAVDWANTSWQQASVEAKKLVMRFVGSQVTMEVKRLTYEEFEECRHIAHRSFRAHARAIRGQTITEADDPEWHLANALMDKMTGGGE